MTRAPAPPAHWRSRGSPLPWSYRWALYTTGQSLTEYALIILMIAVAVVGVVTLFGGALSSTYDRVTSSFIVINSK
jgi:Flp pilus assembly pilin Flp